MTSLVTLFSSFCCSSSGTRGLPSFPLTFVSEIRARVRFRALAGANSISLSRDEDKKQSSKLSEISEKLEVLWDDGYGTKSVKDYLDIATDMIKPDNGPPRWFCPVECGNPIKGSPVLLFLPGMDGTGLGLILHHKALGKVFEVRCLHIPVHDRTPLEGLLRIIENTMMHEHALYPNRPIYLVGDSMGGCLALAVAARNPTVDLILILSNPATSFRKSQLQPLLPILEALPANLLIAAFYSLIFVIGDPIKMPLANIDNGIPPSQALDKLLANTVGVLPHLSGIYDILPKETLSWKLKLLRSAAAYTNSRLHAVKAEVLVLASGKDNMLPSGDEAQRLWTSLENCKVRYFKDNGHALLLEADLNLLSVIKATHMYRHSRRYDYISDYVPPSMSEYMKLVIQEKALFRLATSPVMFSTLGDGKIMRGLAGIPSKGPVLLVGYHMLNTLDLPAIIEEFLKEKKVMVRGITHPLLFTSKNETPLQEFSGIDKICMFGAVPVSASYFYKLMSTDSIVLLFPGGMREYLHQKGEEYKCFWPEQPEFVRMAARFGATIVPFGAVGEDDILHYVLDYNDQMKIPILREYLIEQNKQTIKLRTDAKGEVANQELFEPVVLPKIPGRFYFLFGKPIETKGKKEELKDKVNANEMYLNIKSEVENIMAYLLKKREKDPYRGLIERTVFKVIQSPVDQVPTFEP